MFMVMKTKFIYQNILKSVVGVVKSCKVHGRPGMATFGIWITYLCLVLLQVPKKFGLVQIFCAKPKIDLHVVQVPNFLCLTNRWILIGKFSYCAGTKCNSIFGLAQNTWTGQKTFWDKASVWLVAKFLKIGDLFFGFFWNQVLMWWAAQSGRFSTGTKLAPSWPGGNYKFITKNLEISTSERSSSSHLLTIPESTNHKFCFRNFLCSVFLQGRSFLLRS